MDVVAGKSMGRGPRQQEDETPSHPKRPSLLFLSVSTYLDGLYDLGAFVDHGLEEERVLLPHLRALKFGPGMCVGREIGVFRFHSQNTHNKSPKDRKPTNQTHLGHPHGGDDVRLVHLGVPDVEIGRPDRGGGSRDLMVGGRGVFVCVGRMYVSVKGCVCATVTFPLGPSIYIRVCTHQHHITPRACIAMWACMARPV